MTKEHDIENLLEDEVIMDFSDIEEESLNTKELLNDNDDDDDESDSDYKEEEDNDNNDSDNDDDGDDDDDFDYDDDDNDEDEDDDEDFDGDEIVINDEDDENEDDDDDEDDEDEDDDEYIPSPTSQEEESKFKDLYMRKCADLENFKKRAEKERRDVLRFGNEALIREILTVVDNLERAIEHINDEDAANTTESLGEGVELTIKNMLAILGKFGVEEVTSYGESFDPTKHEAISHEESDEHESGKVVKELQKGYFLKDRLLRPSLVIVAK